MLYRSCTGRPVWPLRRRYAIAAHSIRPHVTRPTTSSTIHELTHRPETMSTRSVVGTPSSWKPGKKPWSCEGLQPESTAAVAIPTGRRAQRRRRFEGTVHLSGRECCSVQRSEEHTSELQSLMRISYAVFCLNKK